MTPTPELTVLVVEDDFMVASIHTRFVERVDGFRVVGVAATGSQALDEVARLSPDVLLLDVHLPDFSGIELLRRLRGRGDDADVIVITAAREADTVRAAAAGGAAHYVVKPFPFEDLAARLEDVRRSREALARIDERGDGVEHRDRVQAGIDEVFNHQASGREARERLPKGLSAETARAVLAALESAGELSATECADAVGVSRVSARRYLEHFASTGRIGVRLNYGTAGRPERRYRG
ncbi:response regulator of citrate/malate metabolism [Nocardioides luteus]|uniref:Transcriptional regulatory protein n=1 Tax=Nocardioides luteus TaxID=1844 RepID=A0ABQ5SSQ1_9ACTN|nr:response regulator [Nocardioides luteus]MDR7311144.1 response regulator of citrate/malate metabolism [Nocardioides luteus]GGR62572.1 transcriptional regulatory protein [Nocardioides luteus]GLJ66690.1 transcriptional regulatory protein [Nocardioides luteus]